MGEKPFFWKQKLNEGKSGVGYGVGAISGVGFGVLGSRVSVLGRV